MFKYLLLALLSFNSFANTVLLIGDSHSVGPFGQRMDQNLRDGGYRVATFASCGSIGRWWTNGQETPCGFFSRDLDGQKFQAPKHPTPILQDLLAEIQPDVVIMQFGGNYRGYREDFIREDIARMVRLVRESGARCFWIGSPDTRSYRDKLPWLYGLIREALNGECPVFESHKYTRYPDQGGDGTHYWSSWGTPIAQKWADEAFKVFQDL